METEPRTGTAIIFPGIGPSRFTDVAKFMLINPAARALVARADETLGYSLVDRYREAEGEYTEFARVAFLVNCLALATWSEEAYEVRPEICAGPSFGGTPAAVYSGALTFSEAVWMTARWGHYLDAYFASEYQDVVTQSFARIPEDRFSEVLKELDEQGEWYDVACYIDHDFYMLSVREGSLERVNALVRAAGGLPLYTMSPPMHSSAFRPLRDTIERELVSELHFTDPAIPIISDHDGTPVSTADGVRTLLLDAIVRQVRWPAVIDTLKRMGIGRLHVSGQDGLWGRVDCVTSNFEVIAIKPETALRPRRRTAMA
jgi:[acyl-carrier-protein] S-malonyltransferase